MLTKDQERAVNSVYGPIMVVAGPGSGKTRVLTMRIQNLLRFTTPERIVVFTFARKAAKEMKSRFAMLTDEKTAQRVVFGTFHSVFYRWLRRWGVIDKDMIVLEKEDRAETGSSILFASKGDEVIDYEDILLLMDREIENHRMWKEYDFFLIDEFQDIDPLQFSIVQKMVGGDRPNLYVTGDEDQSIYAFRGSDPSIFLNFQKTYKTAVRIDLSVNFRCSQKVVEAAGKLIKNNRERFIKNITACDSAEIGKVELFKFKDDREELRDLSKKIVRDHASEIAVLCRTKKEAITMALGLEEVGLRVNCKELEEQGTSYCPDLRRHVLVRREMDLIKSFANHPDSKELYRELRPCLNVLTRSGSWRRAEEGFSLLEVAAQNKKIDDEDRLQLQELKWILDKIHRSNTELGGLRVLIKIIGHTSYFSEALKRTKDNGYGVNSLFRQLTAFVIPAKEIFVGTMHSAKGLEFENVYLPSLIEGKCPREEALVSVKQMEEERRLFYVALTRAKSKVKLSYYEGETMKISVFLKEIGAL